MTNTSETSVRFNVQLEWTKWHPEPMTDEKAYELAETFRVDYSTIPMMLHLNGPDWTELQEGDEVFDLGNGGRPLWFHLKSGGMHNVEVRIVFFTFTFHSQNCCNDFFKFYSKKYTYICLNHQNTRF